VPGLKSVTNPVETEQQSARKAIEVSPPLKFPGMKAVYSDEASARPAIKGAVKSNTACVLGDSGMLVEELITRVRSTRALKKDCSAAVCAQEPRRNSHCPARVNHFIYQ
jgi:hypothetical protein